jgi:hypothetical protein
MSVALVLSPTTAVLESASAGGPAGHHLDLLLGFFLLHFSNYYYNCVSSLREIKMVKYLGVRVTIDKKEQR